MSQAVRLNPPEWLNRCRHEAPRQMIVQADPSDPVCEACRECKAG
jgi:hypothetical protein